MLEFGHEQCIRLNNHAVELFERGCFHGSAAIFKEVLDAFSNVIPSRFGNGAHCYTPQNTQLHRWSKQPRIQAKGKDEIFVHCRTVYLRCPDSFEEDLKRYYVALILYNIAVCFHMLSLIGERNPCSFGDFSSKAFSIYNMAFATKKLSLFKDGVLLTVLFNNSGQLLYRQGRTFEATKRLGLVQELISTLPMNSFAPDDYDGMFLNSLMDSDTASAA